MLSQIKYKLEQFLLDFNRRYDGIKVMYLVILILLSLIIILMVFDNKTYQPSENEIKIDQMIADVEIINNHIDSIQSDLDSIIEALKEKDVQQ